MSMLNMTDSEIMSVDSQVESIMDWAQTSQAEAEQLAFDATRLLSCTSDRLCELKNQGFFKRCWNRFTGKNASIEYANTDDIIQMQSIAFRYLDMIQGQGILMGNALLSLKNTLKSLAIKEAETRELVDILAQKTASRFEKLEKRVDQLEITTSLQGWLLSLDEREYDKRYPTKYMRLLRVINDFYSIKDNNWNTNDLLFMKKAIRIVGLEPEMQISIHKFIETINYEINNNIITKEEYKNIIPYNSNLAYNNQFVQDNVLYPFFLIVNNCYCQGDGVENILELEKNINIDSEYKFQLYDIAIDILSGMRLSKTLMCLPENLLNNVAQQFFSDTPYSGVSKQIILENKAMFEEMIQTSRSCGLSENEVREIVHQEIRRHMDAMHDRGYTHDRIYVCNEDIGLNYYLDPKDWSKPVEPSASCLAVGLIWLPFHVAGTILDSFSGWFKK